MTTTVIDWSAILGDIAYLLGDEDQSNGQRTPLGTRALGARLGVHRETIRRWQDGAQPYHADGEMLLGHWCTLTGKASTFAPRMRPSLSPTKV